MVEASAAPVVHELSVPYTSERPRLDAFVVGGALGISRAQIQRLIDDGDVTVDGAVPAKAGIRLKAGARVVVTIRPAVPIALAPEAMALAILHEDAHLIVLDKPAGLVVHPAPGHATGTLVHGLLHHVDDFGGIGGELRPGIVHRLDRDTTGVMVVAKDEATLTALAAAWQDKRAVEREYVAVCGPAPPVKLGDVGTIRTLYGRHPVDRKRFSSRVATGKPAITHWRVLERLPLATALVRLRLETGRTHQIRVHFADAGWPLVGDQVYGRRYDGALAAAATTLGRQALHAARLAFVHPATGARLEFETPPPADFAALLATVRAAG
ncbi:MAG: RluA family pseudouridine synthase [Myxococcales bacterium]|nr:RluA family pseudouridine synthase [Myxococcales bacterium]